MSRKLKLLLIDTLYIFILLSVFILSSNGLQYWVSQLKANRKPYDISKLQRARLYGIEAGLEKYMGDYHDYPPSQELDPLGLPYCGAMKLAEAMVGRDLMGFHPESQFRLDGLGRSGNRRLYGPFSSNKLLLESLNRRSDPYLEPEIVNLYLLRNLYSSSGEFSDLNDMYMLFDEFKHNRNRYKKNAIKGDKKIGTPVLYYKARRDKSAHDLNDPNNPDNIYDYRDNHSLLALGVPGSPNTQHPLYLNPRLFYELTQDKAISDRSMPYRADSFILWSAGPDGLFGTSDDITNYKPLPQN